MTTEKFKAIVVTEHENNVYSMEIVDKEISSLPEGDILINVKHSSLKYKAALSATGNILPSF